MENLIYNWILSNWTRKIFAIVAATVLWVVVHQTLTATKTLCGVPVRVVNVPAEKTLDGLFPNGLLSKRLTLTITGVKNVVQLLEPSDVEVVIDALQAPDDWVVQIDTKNLISLNPDIMIAQNIQTVTHPELILTFKKRISAIVPIVFEMEGTLPEGYEWKGIFPTTLTHTINATEEEIKELKQKGLLLKLNLQEILPFSLNLLTGIKDSSSKEIVSIPIPEDLKKVHIPSRPGFHEPLNDPHAGDLHVELIRKLPKISEIR